MIISGLRGQTIEPLSRGAYFVGACLNEVRKCRMFCVTSVSIQYDSDRYRVTTLCLVFYCMFQTSLIENGKGDERQRWESGHHSETEFITDI